MGNPSAIAFLKTVPPNYMNFSINMFWRCRKMILHIDMDAFFAAVEQRDNPALQHRPVIVAGNSKRSVVSTASYEARKFGIRSAMPVFEAKQKCAGLIIVPGNMGKYRADSKKIMA